MGSNTHTHQRTQLTIVTNIIEREFVAAIFVIIRTSSVLPWFKKSLTVVVVFFILIDLASTAGRPGSSEVPRNPLTRSDVSSIPANGIFPTKKNEKNENKNAQRVEND